MAYWLFQGNPKYYRLIDAIRELEEIPWRVNRYNKQISVGDGVLIWLAGRDRGIYALGEISQEPQVLKTIPDLDYFIEPSQMSSKPQAMVKLTHRLIDQPLLYPKLKDDPVLRKLWIICKPPIGTNFPVATDEWQRVQALI